MFKKKLQPCSLGHEPDESDSEESKASIQEQTSSDMGEDSDEVNSNDDVCDSPSPPTRKTVRRRNWSAHIENNIARKAHKPKPRRSTAQTRLNSKSGKRPPTIMACDTTSAATLENSRGPCNMEGDREVPANNSADKSIAPNNGDETETTQPATPTKPVSCNHIRSYIDGGD